MGEQSHGIAIIGAFTRTADFVTPSIPLSISDIAEKSREERDKFGGRGRGSRLAGGETRLKKKMCAPAWINFSAVLC